MRPEKRIIAVAQKARQFVLDTGPVSLSDGTVVISSDEIADRVAKYDALIRLSRERLAATASTDA